MARFELRLGLVATAAMGAFLVGALLWLLDDRARPRAIPANLFHVGAIDVAGVCVMAIACGVAHRVARRGLSALRGPVPG